MRIGGCKVHTKLYPNRMVINSALMKVSLEGGQKEGDFILEANLGIFKVIKIETK